MDKVSLAQWKEEGTKLFGEDYLNWKFVCPACGKVSTTKEYKDIDVDPNCAYQECIGRFTGKGSPVKDSKTGCNWAAYGFFGTMGKGRIVVSEEGNDVEVFCFAEPEKVE